MAKKEMVFHSMKKTVIIYSILIILNLIFVVNQSYVLFGIFFVIFLGYTGFCIYKIYSLITEYIKKFINNIKLKNKKTKAVKKAIELLESYSKEDPQDDEDECEDKDIEDYNKNDYEYPIDEDYNKKSEYIKEVISNIENKISKPTEFIQKDSYKINYKNELNEQQLEAVQTIEKPVLIIAGAGTGKTKTLSYRVAYMIENGIKPENILLLTFTRKASKEMLDRTKKLLGLNNLNIQGGTFHSFANHILRKYSKVLNINSNFTILDDADSEDVIDLVKRELKLEKVNNKALPKKSTVHNIISASKNLRKPINEVIALKYPDFIEFIQHIELINEKYIEYNKEHSLYDYDDLLEVLYNYLKSNVMFKIALQDQYRYIMIDEFQDTNIIQKLIIDELASKHENIMVVGDDAQSIYSFRGANFENILYFPDTYKDCKIVKLEKNYRSCQSILDFSNEIINNFSIGYKKELYSDNKNNIMPIVQRFGDEETEAEYITNQIIDLYNNGASYKDIAILYRAGYHSNYMQTSLLLHNIPYVVYGGIKFVERKHVKDIIAYLRILLNPYDAVSWNRVLKLIESIGNATASKIVEAIKKNEGKVNFEEFKNKKFGAVLDNLNLLKFKYETQ